MLFPAIYFAAADGVLSAATAEVLWSVTDWMLKMVITTSFVEVDFYSITQRNAYYITLLEKARLSAPFLGLILISRQGQS